jgi:hypothetical protein
MNLRKGFGIAALVAVIILPSAPAHAEQALPDRVWSAYAAAIRDAAVSLPGEVATDLVVAAPSDPRTEWQLIDGEEHMLVTRLGFRAVSEVAPGEAFRTSSYVFTAVPGNVQEVCAEYGCARMTPKRLDRQLKQIFGLPPDADYSVATRMWVRPADLFRPCTQVDPTIPTCPQLVVNTFQSGVDRSQFLFEQGMSSWRLQRKGTTTRISCAQDFRNTMGGNCYGYPWTRLGYTYDWTPGAKDRRGVTEFVIAPGSRVVLHSAGPIGVLETGERSTTPSRGVEHKR